MERNQDTPWLLWADDTRNFKHGEPRTIPHWGKQLNLQLRFLWAPTVNVLNNIDTMPGQWDWGHLKLAHARMLSVIAQLRSWLFWCLRSLFCWSELPTGVMLKHISENHVKDLDSGECTWSLGCIIGNLHIQFLLLLTKLLWFEWGLSNLPLWPVPATSFKRLRLLWLFFCLAPTGDVHDDTRGNSPSCCSCREF